MRMMRKVIALAIAGSLSILSATVTAATSPLPVTKAPFPVQFNGVSINNQTAQYPLLLYKDITYVPMTWDYCQSLALQVYWNQESGLAIAKLPSKGIAVKPEAASHVEKLQNASLPTFPITVNGKPINNSNEPYPLLVHKDITYFPLTWRFVHDEFGWVTQWDSTEGLRIETDQEQILTNIFYEDDSYLYLDTTTSGFIKIAKDLQADPILLNNNEVETIRKLADTSSGVIINTFEGDKDKTIERVENMVRYHGIDIMDLAAVHSVQNKPLGFVTTIGADTELIVIGARKDDANSEKWWQMYPVFYSFILTKGQSPKQIPGMTQLPSRIMNKKDGSIWIVSDADPLKTFRPINTASQVGLIEPNGDIHGLNAELNSNDVEIVSLQENRVILKAFNNRFSTDLVKETNGFYSAEKNFKTNKLSDLSVHSAYIDSKGNLYFINKGNAITSVNANVTWHRFDYELKKLLSVE